MMLRCLNQVRIITLREIISQKRDYYHLHIIAAPEDDNIQLPPPLCTVGFKQAYIKYAQAYIKVCIDHFTCDLGTICCAIDDINKAKTPKSFHTKI